VHARSVEVSVRFGTDQGTWRWALALLENGWLEALSWRQPRWTEASGEASFLGDVLGVGTASAPCGNRRAKLLAGPAPVKVAQDERNPRHGCNHAGSAIF